MFVGFPLPKRINHPHIRISLRRSEGGGKEHPEAIKHVPWEEKKKGGEKGATPTNKTPQQPRETKSL